MPELPEVETTVRGLRERVMDKTITDFWCDHANMVRYISPTELGRIVTGQKIVAVRRRAKHILIDLKNKKTLVVHMKMTGHLLVGKYNTGSKVQPFWVPEVEPWGERGPLNDPYNRFIHAVFSLSNGPISLKLRGARLCLAFCDMRKFGKIAIHDTDNLHNAKELANLGPELWELDAKKFIAIYRNIKSGQIKRKLLDQKVLAGVGNIYADESLWASGIHPLSQTNKIPNDKLLKLFKSLGTITKRSLKTGGDSMSDYRNVDGVGGKFQNFHKAYKQTDKPCKQSGCHGKIERIVLGARGTHYCPKHQTLYGQ